MLKKNICLKCLILLNLAKKISGLIITYKKFDLIKNKIKTDWVKIGYKTKCIYKI